MHEAQPVEDLVLERGLLTVPDEVWQLAVRRAAVIGPLAAAPSVGAGAVDTAGYRAGGLAAAGVPAAGQVACW